MIRLTWKICAGQERLACRFRPCASIMALLLALMAGGCTGANLQSNPVMPALATRAEATIGSSRATVPSALLAPASPAARGGAAGRAARPGQDQPAGQTVTPTASAESRAQVAAVQEAGTVAFSQAGGARPATPTARAISATLGSQAGVTAPTPVAPPAPGTRLVVHTPAHVRQGPGTNYPILGTSPAGATYAVSGKNPDGT